MLMRQDEMYDRLSWAAANWRQPGAHDLIASYCAEARSELSPSDWTEVLKCHALVQSLWLMPHQCAALHLAVLGGLSVAGDVARSFGPHISGVILAGNEAEQELFTRRFRSACAMIRLAPSANTFEEATKIIAACEERQVSKLAIVTHEVHAVRAVLTLVAVCRSQRVHLRLWGLPVLDKDRSALPDGLRDFAVVESALRLRRYQSK